MLVAKYRTVLAAGEACAQIIRENWTKQNLDCHEEFQKKFSIHHQGVVTELLE